MVSCIALCLNIIHLLYTVVKDFFTVFHYFSQWVVLLPTILSWKTLFKHDVIVLCSVKTCGNATRLRKKLKRGMTILFKWLSVTTNLWLCINHISKQLDVLLEDYTKRIKTWVVGFCKLDTKNLSRKTLLCINFPIKLSLEDQHISNEMCELMDSKYVYDCYIHRKNNIVCARDYICNLWLALLYNKG